MENNDIEQIEAYLRGKMTPEERSQFESALAADPELRRQTDELRQFANDLRQVARADLRKRVETVRDQIMQEEAGQQQPASTKTTSTSWIKSAMLLVVGILLGFALGWLLFYQEESDNGTPVPVAQTPFDEIYRAQIPGPQSGKTISFTVLYDPKLDTTAHPVRHYKFYGLDGGLCIYAGRNDNFWKKPLELSLSGSQFFLKIGEDKFLIISDGVERPLPLE